VLSPKGYLTMAATNAVNETAVEQLIQIRDSGATNMMDMCMVQHLANERGMYELVVAIEDADRHGYMDLLHAMGQRA